MLALCCLGFALCLVAGCKGKPGDAPIAGHADDSVSCDTLPLDSTLGRMLHAVYGGTVEVDGARVAARLDLLCQEYSGDGRFCLVYGPDSARVEGRRHTLRGTPDDPDATVWQFVGTDSAQVFSFLHRSDSILVQLSATGGKFPGEDAPLLKRESLTTDSK